MPTLIFDTFVEFTKRQDKTVNGVSAEFAEKHPAYASDNNSNRGCWNCTGCTLCLYCIECEGCRGCLHSFYSTNLAKKDNVLYVHGGSDGVLAAIFKSITIGGIFLGAGIFTATAVYLLQQLGA